MDQCATHILVVEDEVDMARVLEFNLTNQGHSVAVAPNGAAAREHALNTHPHLIILDLRLPDAFGLDLLQEFKENPATREIPVVVVSALGEEETVVEALNLGAEDFVTKPFRLQELLARVAGVLRRTASDEPPTPLLTCGDITVDLETREAGAGGNAVALTRSEFDLLVHFILKPGRVCTRAQLCHQALGSGGAVQERTIDAHIRTIRRKLGDAGRQLVTVWGIGYKLVENGEDDA